MDLGAILLLLAVLLGVGFFLAAPLMRGATPPGLDESPEASALLAERDRVITALQELVRSFGKIRGCYPEQRASLLQRGGDPPEAGSLAASTDRSDAGAHRAVAPRRWRFTIGGPVQVQDRVDAGSCRAAVAKSAGFALCNRC
jgi:hypothetical protein